MLIFLRTVASQCEGVENLLKPSVPTVIPGSGLHFSGHLCPLYLHVMGSLGLIKINVFVDNLHDGVHHVDLSASLLQHSDGHFILRDLLFLNRLFKVLLKKFYLR